MTGSIIGETKYTNVFRETHSFTITPDWEVEVDLEPKTSLGGATAIILGGIATSLDSIVTHQSLFDISKKAYIETVRSKEANSLVGVDVINLRANIANHIGRISRNATSPLRTNIYPFIVGATKRKLLVLGNSFDEEFGVSVIQASCLSDNKKVDVVFKNEAVEAFLRRRKNFIETGKSIDHRNKILEEERIKRRLLKPSIETIERLEGSIVEVRNRQV